MVLPRMGNDVMKLKPNVATFLLNYIVFIRLRTLALIKVGERSIKAVWIIRISAYGGMKSGKSAI